MKNAMKKLMSLLLVAVLLVAAVPFQAAAATDATIEVVFKVDDEARDSIPVTPANGASATAGNLLKYYFAKDWADNYELTRIFVNNRVDTTDTTVEINVNEKVYIALTTKAQEPDPSEPAPTDPEPVAPISIVVKVNDSDNVVWEGTKVPANGKSATVENLINYCWNSSWDNVYSFDHAWSRGQQKNVALSGSIMAGDIVFIMLKEAGSTSSNGSGSSSGTTNNKFPHNVYLNIYKDTKVGNPDKTVNITNGIALDGKVTMAEVKTVVANYYTAKDSMGITFDGLYLGEGASIVNYVNDVKDFDENSDVNAMRAERTVYINVFIGNANAKSTSNAVADSSNPKTGDSIFMAVSVMGLSAAALATAFFFYNKKRQAI